MHRKVGIENSLKNVMTEVEVKAQTLENTTGIESSLQEHKRIC